VAFTFEIISPVSTSVKVTSVAESPPRPQISQSTTIRRIIAARIINIFLPRLFSLRLFGIDFISAKT
jgi:hypothetical protein